MQSSMTYKDGIIQIKHDLQYFLERISQSSIPMHRVQEEVLEIIHSLDTLLCESCNHPCLDPDVFSQTNNFEKVNFEVIFFACNFHQEYTSL